MEAVVTSRAIDGRTKALYARFPHLARIESMWGTAQCRRYIFRLMTRGAARGGFPKEHFATMMYLLLEHDTLFPEYENEGYDHRASDDLQVRSPDARSIEIAAP